MIIFRYFLKEVFYTMLAVTTVIAFIFICNQFVRYLGFVAHGKYATDMLLRLVSLEVPVLFSLLLPVGLFLGLLLVYGRLYADSEMTALISSGFSRLQLLAMTMFISFIVFFIVAILVFEVGPLMADKRYKLMNLASSTAAFQIMIPGRFQSSMKGRNVFYVKKLSHDREVMNDLFIAQRLKDKGQDGTPKWVVFSARKGKQKLDDKTGDHFIIARDGYRYQGVPGQKDFQVAKYENYGLRLKMPSLIRRNKKTKEIPTLELFKSLKNKDYMSELQWRASMPISVIVLSFLAIPLSRVRPRIGRFRQILPALLIYVVYVNMLFVSRTWLEEGMIPFWIGLWWTHIAFFIIAGLLWMKGRLV